MENLNHFFECYFNISIDYEELESILKHIKKKELQPYTNQLLKELSIIIKTNNYEKALQIMKKQGRKMSLEKTKKLINFLYYQLNNISTNITYHCFCRKK